MVALPTTRDGSAESLAQRKRRRVATPIDPVADYAAGEVIASKYELLRPLGEGGMGSVWLALNLTLEVEVAIKLVRAQRAGSSAAQRLLQEAKAAARLEHPSIVQVFDFGQTERDDPFIVMEVVRGESLAELLDRKSRISAINAVQLLLPIASALAAAHAKSIVHRDVKPENIILMTAETGAVIPKLVDFGVAKLSEEEMSGGRRLTMDGQVVGSPDYMSPEQAKAQADVDERSDVWALCVILYECLVGRRPFEGGSFAELVGAILKDEPVPTLDLGAGDEALWGIIARGLAKDRDERWRTMRTLGSQLAGWADDLGIDTDISGSSLAIAWLREGARSPISINPLRLSSSSPPAVARRGAPEAAPVAEAAPGAVDSDPVAARRQAVTVLSGPSSHGPTVPKRRTVLATVASLAVAAIVGSYALWGTTANDRSAGMASSRLGALARSAGDGLQRTPAPLPSAAPTAASSTAASSAIEPLPEPPTTAPATPEASPSAKATRPRRPAGRPADKRTSKDALGF